MITRGFLFTCLIFGFATFIALATQITGVTWDRELGVMVVRLDPFPPWHGWRMFIDGTEVPMDGGDGRPVVRPNAPIDQEPKAVFIGTTPWVSPLPPGALPCSGTIQFVIPGLGRTNIFSYDLTSSYCFETQPGVTAVGGTILQDTIWQGKILVMSSVFVPSGITLTILPGTVVRFHHYRGYTDVDGRLGIRVEGTLVAVGTPDDPIRFTSDAETPINGDWQKIKFWYSDDSIVKYAIVEFALQGVSGYHSDVTVSHCIVRWVNWEGVYFENHSKPTIEYNRIYEHGYHGIALEQYNEANIHHNTIWGNNGCGIVVLGSTAHVHSNVIFDNRQSGILMENMVEVGAYIYGNDNAIFGNGGADVVTDKGTASGTNRLRNTCSYKCVEIDHGYPDIKDYELGYVPSDAEDKYMYIFPMEDKTRRVVAKIGEEVEMPWSLAWDGDCLWAADLNGRALYRFDAHTGEILQEIPTPSFYRIVGLTWDGEYLWAVDFEKRSIYKIDTVSGAEAVISTLPCPDPGGCRGLAYAKSRIYTLGVSTKSLFAIDPESGAVLQKIDFQGSPNGLTYDGKFFWAPYGNLIGKFDEHGKYVGGVYAASEGTWDLAWDGHYLWASQRTNENWNDPKIYKIQIIDDSLVLP